MEGAGTGLSPGHKPDTSPCNNALCQHHNRHQQMEMNTLETNGQAPALRPGPWSGG